MYLADNLSLFMPLRNDLKAQYEVVSYEHMDDFGEPTHDVIEADVFVVAVHIVKNRRSRGKEPIDAVQPNLYLNRWLYIGELIKVDSHHWRLPQAS